MFFVLLMIALLLAMLVLSNGRKEFQEYFEKNALPNGDKISIVTWAGRGMITGLIAGIIAAMINSNVTEAVGWGFISAICVSWGGPYVEFAIAWNKEPDKPRNRMLK